MFLKKWKTSYKNSIYFGLLVHFQEYNLYWEIYRVFKTSFSFLVECYLVYLLISLSYCEYVPLSTITNIPFYWTFFQWQNIIFIYLNLIYAFTDIVSHVTVLWYIQKELEANIWLSLYK
jgi:hypothetical protein